VQAEAERQAVAAAQTRVIDGLGHGLANMAEGDLTFRIDDFPASYERLKADFNGAIAHLEDTLGAIATSSRIISASTHDIASASSDLAIRTENQAESVGSAVTTVNEIAAMVEETEQGARRAKEAVNLTKSDSENSRDIVRGAIDAITRIEKSSQKIAQIIGVIDEIAFQTNLLALNAGVEAARAGEAGRGFAVVAAEVRNLAQRSAEAAKEIKTIVGVASSEVQDGVDKVSETGRALERISAHVAEIANVAEETAARAEKQSAALHRIDAITEQMDGDTQKNAAMVKQTATATQSLQQETDALAQGVAKFKFAHAVEPARRKVAQGRGPVVALKRTGSGSGSSAVRKAESREESEWAEF